MYSICSLMLSPLFANVNKKKEITKKKKTVKQGSDAMLVYCSPEVCSRTWVGLHGAVALKKEIQEEYC